MRPEIRRHIADLQPPCCFADIGVRGRPRYLPAISFVPFSVRGEKVIGRRFIIVVQANKRLEKASA